jgi:hypothetical protein
MDVLSDSCIDDILEDAIALVAFGLVSAAKSGADRSFIKSFIFLFDAKVNKEFYFSTFTCSSNQSFSLNEGFFS